MITDEQAHAGSATLLDYGSPVTLLDCLDDLASRWPGDWFLPSRPEIAEYDSHDNPVMLAGGGQ